LAWEEITSILLYFLQNGIHTSRYILHSIQYLINHPDYLIPTSKPLDQLDHTDHPTNQPDKLPNQPSFPDHLIIQNILTSDQPADPE